MDETYKLRHEQFVSGSNGTTLAEISNIASLAPCLVLVRNLLYLTGIFSELHAWVAFSFQQSILVVPLILVFTISCGNLFEIYFGLTSLCILLVLIRKTNSRFYTDAKKRLDYITWFRAYVNIASCIAILAVDFAIYPRRFAKAEVFGSGIMDVGVGAFIVSNAIVSPEAKTDVHSRSRDRCVSVIWRSCVSCTPLLMLGLGRLLSVKGSNYHEHVTEYGVHWNFFFTLAAVKILSSTTEAIFAPKRPVIIAVVVAIMYQTYLTHMGGHDYLIMGRDGNGGRHGLWDANREGIHSSVGYLSLYLASVQLGKFLMSNRPSWQLLAKLLLVDGVLWCLLHVTQGYIQQISRRSANVSFIVWMCAYNVQSLSLFLFVHLVTSSLRQQDTPADASAETARAHHSPADLLEAVNRNSLAYFLLANVLTGLVNLSMSTMDSTASTAVFTLVVYMTVLSVFAAFFYARNVTLKVW